MGCQMNEYDSEHIGQTLKSMDFVPTESPADADIVLVNTCTVRAKAEQKAFSLLGRMISLKKRRPNLVLGILGCIAQQQGAELLRKFPELDLVMGPREIHRVQEIVERIYRHGEKIVATDLDGCPIPFLRYPNGYFRARITDFLAIMQGCNNFCSYCIVPYVRGREVNRSPDDILHEARYLLNQGVKEITLLGQNVNSYRWAGDRPIRFPDLLRQLSRLDGLLRIRFTTSHPKDLSPELIACFGELSNLCSHIHLPFQAGCNKILHLMNRGYTRETYLKLVEQLRYARPGIAITSDAMVGFPGERHEDFLETMDLIKRIEFDTIFSFKYSDRKGTKAETMGGKISETEKTSRLKFLQHIQKEITGKKNRALEGREEEVLVEGRSRRGDQWTGRTSGNKIVNFTNETEHLRGIIKVKIKYGFAHSLQGEASQ